MSQGPLCPNLTKKVQKEVSQMANHKLSCAMPIGGLSVNLNHLKMGSQFIMQRKLSEIFVDYRISFTFNEENPDRNF